jgi:hypothetical protein
VFMEKVFLLEEGLVGSIVVVEVVRKTVRWISLRKDTPGSPAPALNDAWFASFQEEFTDLLRILRASLLVALLLLALVVTLVGHVEILLIAAVARRQSAKITNGANSFVSERERWQCKR